MSAIDAAHRLFAVEEIPHVLTLAERFQVPPFSVLKTDEGWWLERKRLWKGLGIRSELGRDARSYGPEGYTTYIDDKIAELGGQSIFDPVAAELAYRWFCAPGGIILDPFAGGSVRGIVASLLGYHYYGMDLSERQIEANYANFREIPELRGNAVPCWMNGDAANDIMNMTSGMEADFLFTCPPFHDLEQYSDDPRDLSNMDWYPFLRAYRKAIWDSVRVLGDNRFAAIVVGEIRDKEGNYRDFVGATIEAFQDAGMSYYNDIVLMNPIGTLGLRAGKSFEVTRKVGKRHQNLLVFLKGDSRLATKAVKGLDD